MAYPLGLFIFLLTGANLLWMVEVVAATASTNSASPTGPPSTFATTNSSTMSLYSASGGSSEPRPTTSTSSATTKPSAYRGTRRKGIVHSIIPGLEELLVRVQVGEHVGLRVQVEVFHVPAGNGEAASWLRGEGPEIIFIAGVLGGEEASGTLR